jgi:hypothetical protein
MVSIVTGIIGVTAAIVIVLLIRRDHLHVRYGMWWVLAAVGLAMLGLWPEIIDRLAHTMGIGYPPALALTVGIVIVVLKILIMDLERSRNSIRLQRLVQRIALLEADLRKLEGKSAPGELVAPDQSDLDVPPDQHEI